ncbi:hypothetical protein GWI33_017316 [Rhynchophorus ferrugineus]|uniref:Uncharacterized protein n=1 Tax=Rhynchophorus ferrugineus TaxID=354439 RepID=A0A834HZ04_RHYFE|nr:hypothetical protein GWI33_017316 [Rhynchophorus ferrugineus]
MDQKQFSLLILRCFLMGKIPFMRSNGLKNVIRTLLHQKPHHELVPVIRSAKVNQSWHGGLAVEKTKSNPVRPIEREGVSSSSRKCERIKRDNRL